MDVIIHFMHHVSFVIGIVGCLILAYGVVISFFQFLHPLPGANQSKW